MEQDVLFFGSTAYVTSKFLTQRGMSESTIRSNTSHKKASGKRWYSCPYPGDKKKKLIAYDAIPMHLVKKHNLPDYSELRSIAELSRQKLKNERNVNISKNVKTILDLEYYSWEELKNEYENEFLSGEKLEMFCKTFAILNKIIELKSFGYKLKSLYNAYYQFDGLLFQTDSYHSFCNKIRKILKTGSIESMLLHGLQGLPSNNLKKTEDVLNEILRLCQDGKKPNAAFILQQINDYLIRSNRKTISISSIYNVTSQRIVKNKIALGRHGLKYVENYLLPFEHFSAPSKEGLLWCMDGSRFQFYYKNEKGKFKYITYFIVMEAKDRKIIGYSYDDSENLTMVKKALERSCYKTNYLPYEIISDNSPAMKSGEFKRIISLHKGWGGEMHFIKKNNPRDNAYAERFFGVFQESFCKKYDGYVGDGLKSKYLDGKPSPEEIREYLLKKKLMTKEELITLMGQLINEYNNSGKRLALIDSDSTNHDIEYEKNKGPIKLETIRYAELFWLSRIEKMSHAEVYFDFNGKTYYYQVNDDVDFIYKWHGAQVLVRYNPKDLSQVLLFDLKTDEYIKTVKGYSIKPKALAERSPEQSKELFISAEKKKQLIEKMYENIEQVRKASDKNREKLPPSLLNFGIGSKADQEESEEEFLNQELTKLIQEEINEDKQKEFDDIFENIYLKKGNLKLIKYDRN